MGIIINLYGNDSVCIINDKLIILISKTWLIEHYDNDK